MNLQKIGYSRTMVILYSHRSLWVHFILILDYLHQVPAHVFIQLCYKCTWGFTDRFVIGPSSTFTAICRNVDAAWMKQLFPGGIKHPTQHLYVVMGLYTSFLIVSHLPSEQICISYFSSTSLREGSHKHRVLLKILPQRKRLYCDISKWGSVGTANSSD